MADEKGMFTQLGEMSGEQIFQLVKKNKDDIARFMNKIIYPAAVLGGRFEVLYDSLDLAQKFVKKQYFSYLTYCKQKNRKPVLSVALKDVSVSNYKAPLNNSHSYISGLSEMDDSVKDAYFMASNRVCTYNIRTAVDMYFCVEPQIDNMSKELNAVMKLVAEPEGENLFAIFMEILRETEDDRKEIKTIMLQIGKILDFAEAVKEKAESRRIVIEASVEKCRKIFNEFVSEYEKENGADTPEDEASALSASYGFTEPVNILEKIFDFVDVDSEEKNAFMTSFMEFKQMSDKKSIDDEARKLRKRLSELYYKLYYKVFIKAEKENVGGIVLDMFFNYGIADETLLSKETVDIIKKLSQTGESNNARVYTMREWLHAIYTGEKQPSRNDLDMDYLGYVNDMYRRGDISEDEKNDYISNPAAKVEFEINNFVRMNSRLTNGELSVFCPIMTEENFIGTPDSMYVTDKAVSDAIDWLLETDYSVFHREQMYDDRDNGINNMLISKQVFPDIVLTPVTGSKSRMWQEIDGKRRDTPGRITFPIFTNQDLKDLLVQAAGSFRWQLCKKIQGNYWNVISEKSLTSEYYDYIQFYKKNRDLTDLAKEKIASQLQRARNNFADCFVMDYCLWIKNEVAGSVRLNKVVREIMATYCTPVKEKREKLKNTPMFKEAFARFEREQNRKIKDINNRRAAIRNANGVETPEFIEEARFREEM